MLTDKYGQRWIEKKQYPNLFKLVKKFAKYRICHACCIDEALDWSYITTGCESRLLDSDLKYVLSRKDFINWANK